MLFLAVAAMTVIALGFVLGPLMVASRAPTARAAFDRAVYRDQLKEIEREVRRGVVAESEAASARLELQRRLLATERSQAEATQGGSKPLLAIGIGAITIIIAAAIYLQLGSPGMPDDPYAAREAERQQLAQRQAQMTQIRGMVQKLADEMKANPDNLDGWMRLGRSYAVLGESDKAADAFAQAERLKPDDPQVLMGEADALLTGHSLADPIPEKVVALLQRVETLAPGQPAVMWYLGLHAAQQGDFKTARADWEKVLAALPADSDVHQTVEAALAALKDK
jgi:cytochrome c-type biogenesis protein CcmH